MKDVSEVPQKYCVNCKHFVDRGTSGALVIGCSRTMENLGRSLIYGFTIFSEMRSAAYERGISDSTVVHKICGKDALFFEPK